MTNYFFISSPLHFCISANIAINLHDDTNVAVIISKNKAAAEGFLKIINQNSIIFSQGIMLPELETTNKFLSRKSGFRTLKGFFSHSDNVRIFTGNDRRVEFQYAMHIAQKICNSVDGIYTDDGMVTYSGHKSIKNFAHKYIDPIVKKMFYGLWWKNSITTGSSSWVSTAYVAFPDLVHPLLKSKKLIPIDTATFKSAKFIKMMSEFLEDSGTSSSDLKKVRILLTLPHENFYNRDPHIYDQVESFLCGCFKTGEIAVKPHPRSENLNLLESMFPNFFIIDKNLGMESLLPILNDDCIVMGDISSTLLTTRWIRPDLCAVALNIYKNSPESIVDFCHKIGVKSFLQIIDGLRNRNTDVYKI